jgi:hypothetical protein
MTRSIRMLAIGLVLAASGCGSSDDPADPPDAPEAPDAKPDGMGAPSSSLRAPARGVSAGAGRLEGGPWTLDVQVGAAIEQRAARGGGWTSASGAPHAATQGAQ